MRLRAFQYTDVSPPDAVIYIRASMLCVGWWRIAIAADGTILQETILDRGKLEPKKRHDEGQLDPDKVLLLLLFSEEVLSEPLPPEPSYTMDLTPGVGHVSPSIKVRLSDEWQTVPELAPRYRELWEQIHRYALVRLEE
ncbi:hypothetical protein EON80_08000 [bacterium]|nr:MAG: hypothetical protein EON80_08000 [bacterium]